MKNNRMIIKQENSKTLKITKVLLSSIFVICGLTACTHKEPVMYEDYNEFKAEFNGDELELPNGAEDVRMAISDQGLSKTFLISYCLDDEKMTEYIKKVIREKYGVTQSDDSDVDIEDDYYGILVKDIDSVKPDYTLDDFKYFLSFDAVIDDFVEEYKVLYYYPMLSGSTSKGILINPDTNRLLEFYYATVK